MSSECTLLAASSSALSCFPSPLDLVRKLHTHEDGKDNSTADALLSELLKRSASAAFRSICQRILLLAFIPTIHRTASQVSVRFPVLARDDTSQHVVARSWNSWAPQNCGRDDHTWRIRLRASCAADISLGDSRSAGNSARRPKWRSDDRS